MASSSSSSEEKKIVLISSDKQSFEISEAAALLSVTIKNILEDAEDAGVAGIPLGNVDSKTLVNVIEFCKRHAAGDTDDAKETLTEINTKFIKSFNKDELFEVIMAANYMDIKPLMELTVKTIADEIKSLSVKDCRQYFYIENDFTEEDEKKIREEHAWAFEDLDQP